MVEKNRMNVYNVLLLCCVWFSNVKTGLFVETESCDTTICQTSTKKNISYCFCNSGCFLYEDCCSDSSYKREGESPSANFVKISVLNRRDYKAVVLCSRTSADSCKENIGRSPPVTSKITGITYPNAECAACNGDSENIVTWRVELRCCPEHDDSTDQTRRQFSYIRRSLFSILPGKGKCACKYHAEDDDESLDELELRTYERRDEISRCSSTWDDESIRNKCHSFIEPVFTRNKVYRNLFCAQCNYEMMELVYCKPNIVKTMVAEGKNDSTIYDYCSKNNITDCIQYFKSKTDIAKGKNYEFKDIVNINFAECRPPPGRKCCEGYRFDYQSNRCRKMQRPRTVFGED